MIAVVLTIISVVLRIAHATWGVDPSGDVLELFDLDKEANVPTWFSGLLLAMAAALAAVTWRFEPSPFRRRYWLVLAAVFTLFSLDEVAGLHEGLNRLQGVLDTSGPLFFAWVIPATIAVVAFGLWMLPFLGDLDRRLSIPLVVAGGIYVGGALLLEFVEGALFVPGEEETLTYEMVANTQEFFEMVGVALFIGALFLYLRDDLGVRISQHRTPPNPASSVDGTRTSIQSESGPTTDT